MGVAFSNEEEEKDDDVHQRQSAIRSVITGGLHERRLRTMRWPRSPTYLFTAGLNVLLGLFWAIWGISRDYPWFFLVSALYVLLGVMFVSKAYKKPVDRGASQRITEWGPTDPPTRND